MMLRWFKAAKGEGLVPYVMYIGVGRFRILGGGQGLEYWGGGQGKEGQSQQAHDVVTMSMRCNDVASTSFRRRVPTRFLINPKPPPSSNAYDILRFHEEWASNLHGH